MHKIKMEIHGETVLRADSEERVVENPLHLDVIEILAMYRTMSTVECNVEVKGQHLKTSHCTS